MKYYKITQSASYTIEILIDLRNKLEKFIMDNGESISCVPLARVDLDNALTEINGCIRDIKDDYKEIHW